MVKVHHGCICCTLRGFRFRVRVRVSVRVRIRVGLRVRISVRLPIRIVGVLGLGFVLGFRVE